MVQMGVQVVEGEGMVGMEDDWEVGHGLEGRCSREHSPRDDGSCGAREGEGSGAGSEGEGGEGGEKEEEGEGVSGEEGGEGEGVSGGEGEGVSGEEGEGGGGGWVVVVGSSLSTG